MDDMTFIKATTRKRPHPLPEGFRYCEKDYKIFVIYNNQFRRISPKIANLMCRSLYGVHYYLTRDQLVPIKFNLKGLPTVDPNPANRINLAKPI